MDSVRILKTEMSVTNIDEVTENLIFKNQKNYSKNLS